MAGPTKIEWADASWNPVRGCSRVSEGCRNCYAERLTARFWPHLATFETRPNGVREARWSGEVELIADSCPIHAPLPPKPKEPVNG